MPALRSDALRSRARILEAARAYGDAELRLNDVARDAGVGVGTVYRHFPTVHSLTVALARETLERMLGATRAALADPDAERAFSSLLSTALQLQLSDGGLQIALVSSTDEDPEVTAIKRQLLAGFEETLRRAREVGAVRADVDALHLQRLVCGVEHAARLDGGSADIYLDVLLAGLRPAPVSEV